MLAKAHSLAWLFAWMATSEIIAKRPADLAPMVRELPVNSSMQVIEKPHRGSAGTGGQNTAKIAPRSPRERLTVDDNYLGLGDRTMHFALPAGLAASIGVSRNRVHHQTRSTLPLESLEDRRLLSAGTAAQPISGSAQPITTIQEAPGVSASSVASRAGEFGTPSGVNSSQIGYLLGQVATPTLPAVLQPAGVSIPQTVAGPQSDPQTGADLTVTNLSITILNPDMTSDSAAIVDSQVDSDAYLVPSTPQMLREYLGESSMPMATHVRTAATLTSDAPLAARSGGLEATDRRHYRFFRVVRDD